tara:strand:- start:5134 stop:5412 length:279 start_codon:yes stop_codon:yes gene_type:complete
MPTESNAIPSSSIFGDLISKASQFGDTFFDFKLKSKFLDEESALARSYNTAVNTQASAAIPAEVKGNNDLIKYGAFAVAGLVALMVVLKAVK